MSPRWQSLSRLRLPFAWAAPSVSTRQRRITFRFSPRITLSLPAEHMHFPRPSHRIIVQRISAETTRINRPPIATPATHPHHALPPLGRPALPGRRGSRARSRQGVPHPVLCRAARPRPHAAADHLHPLLAPQRALPGLRAFLEQDRRAHRSCGRWAHREGGVAGPSRHRRRLCGRGESRHRCHLAADHGYVCLPFIALIRRFSSVCVRLTDFACTQRTTTRLISCASRLSIVPCCRRIRGMPRTRLVGSASSCVQASWMRSMAASSRCRIMSFSPSSPVLWVSDSAHLGVCSQTLTASRRSRAQRHCVAKSAHVPEPTSAPQPELRGYAKRNLHHPIDQTQANRQHQQHQHSRSSGWSRHSASVGYFQQCLLHAGAQRRLRCW